MLWLLLLQSRSPTSLGFSVPLPRPPLPQAAVVFSLKLQMQTFAISNGFINTVFSVNLKSQVIFNKLILTFKILVF